MQIIKHLFYQGDALETLKKLPSESVHCCVTSPPYWGLRDYGTPGQIGLERTPEEYVAKLVEIFREVRRVLRTDGTLWLNLGDCYHAGDRGKWDGNRVKNPKSLQNSHRANDLVVGAPNRLSVPGLKPKDLCEIPSDVVRALRADGWWLRSRIPWLKGNPMPENIEDRPTSAVEYWFLLTKNESYFYDCEAVKKPGKEWSGQAGTFNRKSGKMTLLTVPGQARVSHRERDDRVPPGRNRRNSDWFIDSIRAILEGESGTLLHDEDGLPIAVFCNTQGFKEAHFATFPPRLVTPMIQASTSEKGCCPKCGAPWERVVERTPIPQEVKQQFEESHKRTASRTGRRDGFTSYKPHLEREHKTIGWRPTCSCGIEETVPCVVLDPFGGAGTVSLVAKRLGRASIYIDLNPSYVQMALKRMGSGQSLFENHQVEVIR